MSHYAKANISTEQSASSQNARLSREDGNQKRASGAEEASCKGAQTAHTVSLLGRSRRLPKYMHLRSSDDFRRVYAQGRRYEGCFMTVFVLPKDLLHHRFGITASRKAIGNAVNRNRSKRLLREAFRLNDEALDGLHMKYDWVLNARRSLLQVKMAEPLEEMQSIIARVGSDERLETIKAGE